MAKSTWNNATYTRKGEEFVEGEFNEEVISSLKGGVSIKEELKALKRAEYTAMRLITQIIQGCNLNLNSAEKYISIAIDEDLLIKKGEFYKITENGIKFIGEIKSVYERLFLKLIKHIFVLLSSTSRVTT